MRAKTAKTETDFSAAATDRFEEETLVKRPNQGAFKTSNQCTKAVEQCAKYVNQPAHFIVRTRVGALNLLVDLLPGGVVEGADLLVRQLCQSRDFKEIVPGGVRERVHQ